MKLDPADSRAHPLTHLRRHLRRSAPMMIWALLLTVVVGGLHHHADGGTHRECAVCSLSHAPATVTITATVSAPALRYERVAVPALATPRPARVAAAPSRAPPEL